MFLLDKNKFVHDFLPPRRRKVKSTAWAKVIVMHVFLLWTELYSWYNQILVDLTTSICTDVFQSRLRALYPDVGSYKCFVKNQYDDIPTTYFQYKGEHHAIEYDYFISEAIPVRYELLLAERQKAFDYHIIIPITYTSDLQAIEFIINKYKPSGKRYQLIFENLI